MSRGLLACVVSPLLLLACSSGDEPGAPLGSGGSAGTALPGTGGAGGASGLGGAGGNGGSGSGGAKGMSSTLDAGMHMQGDPGMVGVGTKDAGAGLHCIDKAPPGSFEPDLQWAWNGDGAEDNCLVVPLVANFTDDNADGKVDLKDTPDIAVVVYQTGAGVTGTVVVLDGATGTKHFAMQAPVRADVSPAIGDLDGDGSIELVTITKTDDWHFGGLIAFNRDGSVKWRGASVELPDLDIGIDNINVAIANMDNEGAAEILVGNALYDADGALLWRAPTQPPFWSATTAADLDGDGDLEMVLGHAAYHHDGSEYYLRTDVAPGFPQIADFDGDGQPEIVITSFDGVSLLEHDGTVVFANMMPDLGMESGSSWMRPATIHDFDGDGVPEFASSTPLAYSVLEADGMRVWSTMIADVSGAAGGTAFDFLGDGTAEAMYGDEHHVFIFDDHGGPVFTVDRSSNTGVEYPVVADVDNDGSAEIVVVSDVGTSAPRAPTVQVFRDKQDRWIQARRIWNQHTYHVTNIEEDGRVPKREAPHWKSLNSFRTNAQIEGGEVCAPRGPD